LLLEKLTAVQAVVGGDSCSWVAVVLPPGLGIAKKVKMANDQE
jgi:hypothetical protein